VILFRETGAFHRIKYSFSYFFLLFVLITHFILDIKKACCIKLKNYITFYSNNTVTCTPSFTSLSYATDFFTGLLASLYRCHRGADKSLSRPPRRLLIKINELILEDRRISGKSVAEQLGISRERVGSIIHEDLDMLVACFLPGRAKDLSAPM
jgi:hypothetical protein